jgi:predicted secreted protein
MKTLALLATVALMTVMGCKDPTPTLEPILVEMFVGDTYTVSLESTPSTGYRWEVSVSDSIVEVVDHEYRSVSELIGAAGYEDFHFKALSPGETEIEMLYLRPWKRDVIECQPIEFLVLANPL